MKTQELYRSDVFSGEWLPNAAGAALAIVDPPYGEIVSATWDMWSDADLSRELAKLFLKLSQVMAHGAHAFLWGGFGVPGNRTLFRSILAIEDGTPWKMAALNTWKKKRAYGTPWRCLCTREECPRFVLGDIKKPRVFNVQYRDELRGYEGWDAKHPAKDARKRMTMIWDHASDMGKKPHPQHKPAPLVDTQILMCTNPGDLVLDLFTGSGEVARRCAALGRRSLSVGIPDDAITAEHVRGVLLGAVAKRNLHEKSAKGKRR